MQSDKIFKSGSQAKRKSYVVVLTRNVVVMFYKFMFAKFIVIIAVSNLLLVYK